MLGAMVVFAASTDGAPAPTPASSFGCTGAAYRAFDFWLGDWDTFESDAPAGSPIARSQVTAIAGGCAVRQTYAQDDGLLAESILSFDPATAQWQQTWVTNRGSLMVVTGPVADDGMVLEGEVRLRDGTRVMQRITWKAENDGVREWALVSRDGGATWTPAFDVVFRRRP